MSKQRKQYSILVKEKKIFVYFCVLWFAKTENICQDTKTEYWLLLKMRFVGREFQEGFSEEVFFELRSGDTDVR